MVLEYGVERRLVCSNVAEKVKRLSKTRKEMSTYTPDEVAKVLKAADGDLDGHLWYLARSAVCAVVRSAGCGGPMSINQKRR